ncbi:unnamed protein product (macronuclear) [Paramecium tetraurelia]|uniref:AAA+ ATPase domain-containing protein n=1 Tax=Paramecium tetraurelia TaxID=5888 RepID=A0C9T3_PARTE|nr:uncharacterized protein GSPATT00006857001 [Paramecium tetraurelia]CAK67550.1 unnamed protein product [Paramecium tetraurelia]|eukprot:XP_001434947.1 hypothetical protein (macronuclear) [Paramecium tetraurelia strain d4-2]
MNTEQLEQIRLNALQLLDKGKTLYMSDQIFETKKEGYSLMIQGLEELIKYAKLETKKESKSLVKQQIKMNLEILEKLKVQLNSLEKKNNIEQNQNNNQENQNQQFKDAQASKPDLFNSIKTNVKLEDIIGLEQAKKYLQEAVIIPLKFPKLFQGIRNPYKGILLYGPPGTGKTILAKACATESECTFLFVSYCDLISKYVGESEKLIKQLFSYARQKKPCIIFIDAIDSIFSDRECASGELRSVKTQLLIEFQDFSYDQIIVIGETNLPWNIDMSVRKRFERRIYIPLLNHDERLILLQNKLKEIPNNLNLDQFKCLAEKLEGYSGSDIINFIKEAQSEQIRAIQKATHFKKQFTQNQTKYMVCSLNDPEAEEMTLMDIPSGQLLLNENISYSDFLAVLPNLKRDITQQQLMEYKNWTDQFGYQG